MPTIANEIAFEKDICGALYDAGWLYSENDMDYDRAAALFPEDALDWVKKTQPQEWASLVASQGVNADGEFIKRLVKVLATEGTLKTLRSGFKVVGAGGATFKMAQFKPAFSLSPELMQRYEKNRLRVMRQVHYSASNNNSIDLVLFLNGIPVATVELKTDFTQSVEDAKLQYRKDRQPKDPVTHKEEPLLTFKRGALVHFAVSTDEVWMTTKLEGDTTYFLPFNQGNHGGKGNPINPDGYSTSYFWDEILQPDSWLKILGSFVQLATKTTKSASSAKKTTESIIFPRYHQLDAVNKLIAAAKTEGAGHAYLFQHSAGSGKSNTIGWCAHQLSTLHDESDNKVFDTVIVITDRNVLDAQLKDTISQFDAQPGVVQAISGNEGAKSGELAKALLKGALIIVVTLQTFPFVLKDIQEAKGLGGKRFAVIIDEAHSSQSGASARKLRGILASEELSAEEGDGELTTEDLLLAEASTRKLPSNASFLAFTATPKSKTMEVFGRPANPALPASESNKPIAFHTYTMRQAIEEGFILDVLNNYTPYKMAYKLAHGGKDWNAAGNGTGVSGSGNGSGNSHLDDAVDKPAAVKALHRWVRLHPHNIAQKVEIIVEHFRESVGYRLDGKAKAMVVTASRQEAVRYKLAMDRYIKDRKYTDIAALVAFSDDVLDPDSGPDKFNESNMNPQLKGQDIRDAFATDDYQILIVANKFQTGFDQPLLVAMYVDKRIDGITAVQTLSRLNRTMPGKDTTFVLDFVNDSETIRLAFRPYYEATELLTTTDPSLILDLQTKLDAEQIYTNTEARQVAEIFVKSELGVGGKKSQKDLIAALSYPVERFRQRWTQAEQDKDREEIDRLTTFHKNLGAYCRLYDFITQIVSYEDADLEARYILYKHLEPLIAPDRVRLPIDLSEVSLTHYKLKAGAALGIDLGHGADEEKVLKPITAVGTHVAKDPEKVRMDELIEQLNTLFDDGSLSDADRVGLFNHVAEKMLENDELTQQARANNTREQFEKSPSINTIVGDAVIAAMDSYETMTKKVFQDEASMKRFEALLVDYVYNKVKGQQQEGSQTI